MNLGSRQLSLSSCRRRVRGSFGPWAWATLLTWFLIASPARAGSITREVFLDIDGNAISDLTSSPSYPDFPSFVETLTDFFETPTDQFEAYGQRVHGYLVPPVSGNYRFWIASDDNGALHLSTDESPEHTRLIARVPEWTSSREWGRFPEQRSGLINLEANKAYYVQALMKEGGGGDNLAVRWLRPDGVDEGPIPATYLLPWGTAFTPPEISQQPTNTTAIEGEFATFVVKVTNVDPVVAQWRRNGVNLPGENTLVLHYGPVALADNGATFGAFLTNRIGSTNSTVGTLFVLPDTTPPTLVSAVNLGASRIQLKFSEPVEAASASLPANFSVSGGVTVSSAAVETDASVVTLTVSPLTFAQNYTVTVRSLRDRANTPNTILAESPISFLALELVSQGIGVEGGSITRLGTGAFAVTGAGRGSGGNSDQTHFAWEQHTGNFDVQVRVDTLQVTDPYVQAGLMARAELGTNSPYAAVFTGSAQVGSYFESRTTAGATSTTASPRGGFLFNGRHTWLRLQRVNNLLTGYGSFDGITWTSLGSASVTLGSSVYVGLASSSRLPSIPTTATFHDYGVTTSLVTGPNVTDREPLGPTTRRTGVLISEIMYHPKPPVGVTGNLEFIELYNAGPVFEDLGGWRISGAVEYTFPEGFRLEAGAFVVVAADPAAMQSVYSLSGVLGPFTGALNNAGEVIQLLDSFGALKLEIEYSTRHPWPEAADGAGCSLVLSRPSWGAEDPRAWSASEQVGGSPGSHDAVVPNPLRGVVINEFLARATGAQPDFIELFNRNLAEVVLDGCILTDDPTTNRFRIPADTVISGRGHLSFDENQLGFGLSAAGEGIFLLSPDGTQVLDALYFEGQENGVSSGRSPDGAATIRRLIQPTPGTTNAPWRREDIVINEIMYRPISWDDLDEYVELHNRSTQTVNLSGWRFTEGIEFEFGPGVTLAPGGYLVVARDAARLRGNHPEVDPTRIVGDFAGRLSNRGERLTLAKPDDIVSTNPSGGRETNRTYIVIAQAVYRDEDRWHRWADGGGSSLELTDPDADPLEPANWADSDETGKAPWTTLSFTGNLDHGMEGWRPDRFQIGLLGAGECLVDDVEFFTGEGENLLSNGNFEGAGGWEFAGNHVRSRLQTGGAFAGSGCLQIIAQGDGDTGPNSVRTPIASPPLASGSATIRAKVRWQRGWPEILFRTRGNWIEAAGRMIVPANLGTPGQVNSRRLANAGPVITEVRHFPLLPAANEAVTVTARVADPDGVGDVLLRYRVDPSATATTVTMRDDGTGGDAAAGDGLYTAILPGRSTRTVVAFRVETTDTGTPSASRVFPPAFPESECLVRWGDPAPAGSFAHYHLWSTQATENARGNSYGLNNLYRDATLVYGNIRAIYGVGFRDKGSPYHGGYGDFAVQVPHDDLLLGAEDRVLALTGNGDTEETGMRTQVANWIASRMGIPHLHSHYIRLYRNGDQYSNVMEDLEQPNNSFAEGFFPAVDEGDLYKIAVWFEFNNDDRGFDARGATLQRFNSAGLGLKPARYRWNWQTRGWLGSANNLTNIFNLVSAANATTDYTARMQAVADMEQWMRVFAFNRICGNWDSWTFSVGQNMYIYFQPGERAKLLPWDIDFVLGRGNGPTDPLGGGSLGGSSQDPVADAFYNDPTFRRALFRAYLDAAGGPLLPEQYQPQLDARKSVLQRNGFSVGGSGQLRDPQVIATYIDARRDYLLSRVNAADRPFAITTSGGNDFSSSQPFATLAGTAPFAVATIEINGVAYPLRWTNPNTFSVVVPLTAAVNSLTLVGKDRSGNPVAGATDTITVTYEGLVPRAEDFVVINEIQYDAPNSGGSFLELHNRSTTTPFDLSGFVLGGVGYTFPSNSVIAPNSYLVLAKDRTAFALAYGNLIPVFDQFPGSLDNGGETLTLIRPGSGPEGDTIISAVRYDDDPPWPAVAAGQGPSLQLLDPALGSWRAANWWATPVNDPNQVTPARANAGRTTLTAFPTLWINEVLPDNVNGPLDNQGEREPFIELYNSGTNTVDLTSLYLTDAYDDLTRWAFPVGTPPLEPGGFLLIWADGEPSETTDTSLHAGFRLDPTQGSVALVRQLGPLASPEVLDYINYSQLPAGRSFGSYPDGEPRGRRAFFHVTPGATNDPAFPPVTVVINEFMASNTRTLTNVVNGLKDDWFELYNPGTTTVDLTGYYLSDSLNDRTQFQIPPGFVVPPGGFLLVWADDETEANTNGSPHLHVNFKLSAGGEEIGLFGPDGVLVDGISFGPQSSDVSEGRFPDGDLGALIAMDESTPGAPNQLAGGNRPPVITAIPDQFVAEGELLQFAVVAVDDPGQVIRYGIGADAPPEALIDEVTGLFSWTPTELQGPGNFVFTVLATDNGTPARTSTAQVTVGVVEVNDPPSFSGVEDRSVDERSTLSFALEVSDPDLPANTLAFALEGPVPPGLELDPETGWMTWTPTEVQGPGTYPIRVRVTDDGVPPASAVADFTITVNEVNNPPDLAEIQPQSVDEGQIFALQVMASDSDNPPAALQYRLEGTLPPGISIHPDTGLITWAPGEADGPGSYVIVVRVTEKNAAALSTTRSFGLIVNEVNTPPLLSPVADATVEEESTVRFRATAADLDLPAQTLTFSLVGAVPEGASVDPGSGEFVWKIPADFGTATQEFTLRVSDSGPGGLSATELFQVNVAPTFRMVINEIMYQPASTNAEYVELKNASAKTTWDLSGYRLVGEALEFTFPAETWVGPGALLCVVRDDTAFVAAYGTAPRLAGVWEGNLGTSGDYLRLLPPAPATDALSAVRFSASAPWPAAANGGGSALQLIDDRRASARVANWTAVPASSGSRSLVVMTNLWRYYQSGPADASWKEPAFNDSAWPQGRALLYREDASLPAPKNTLLNLGQNTYYFRTTFELPSLPTGGVLRLSTIIDDGAVFYLNGREIHRQNMPEGVAVNFNTFALLNVPDATLAGPISLSAAGLRPGPNVFAVEVHQVNAGSTDVVMGCRLDLQGGTFRGFTPGAPNNVAVARSEIPPVWINEVLPNNTSGRVDAAGEREPWIELVNLGAEPVPLEGWALTDSYDSPAKWTFPPGTTLPAGGFLVVIADGEAEESTAAEPHAGFRLNPAMGTVALARPAGAGVEFVDYVDYVDLAANEAWASLPDGQPFTRSRTTRPTPGAANSANLANHPPVLNAIGDQTAKEGEVLSFQVSATDPDAGQKLTYSAVGEIRAGFTLHPVTGAVGWTPGELDGPGSYALTIRVTDDGLPPLSDEETITITVEEVNRPPVLGLVSPQFAAAGELFSLSVATQDPDFPAQTFHFSLEGAPAGMSIGASSGAIWWTPLPGDGGSWEFVVRVTDDGNPPLSATTRATVTVVGGTFAAGSALGEDGQLHINWASQAEVSYRIESLADLEGSWELIETVTGTGQPMTYLVPINLAPPRFFRVVAP